jgi:SSS family solute:Na+ symporter
VQRALGAPNETVARRGSIFASFLKLAPVYLFIVPGMVCFALARSGKIPELAGMIAPDGHAIPSVAQGSFPMLVQYLLPPGLRGIVVAGLLSALMGSLAGVFNACSTLFTVDLYGKWKHGATQHELVRMGRIATTVMVFIAFAWIPVIKNAHGLYGYLQAVQGYLAPPIFVVFFLGVFFKRMNAQGALWSMLVGFVLGIFRMIVDTPVTLGLRGFQNGYPHGSFLWIVNNIYFQYFSVLITLVSAIVMVAVSYATSQPDYAAIKNLTFATTTTEDKANTRASWSWIEVGGSALVVLCILGAYLYFRG